jgi:type II secretory pathway component PulK
MRNKQRHAFSLLTALTVIVLMAFVGFFVLSLTSKSVKATTLQYQHEQAELYAKSYTEYAVLAVTGNDRTVDCLEDITGNIGDPGSGNGYRIRVHIAYIVNGTKVDTSKCSNTRVLSTSVQTDNTPLSVLIDAYVDYKDPDNTAGAWMTVHRRTIQKI